MVTLYQPATCPNHTILTDYMPSGTTAAYDALLVSMGVSVPYGTFSSFKLQTCPRFSLTAHSYPFVIFSPGMGDSRLLYGHLCQIISMYGFSVISIDHPYDANIVEYPDGTIVTAANISGIDGLDEDLSVRVADVSFVLEIVSSVSNLFGLPPSSININKVVILGHSFGGATAAEAILSDPPLAGGINMDGSLFGQALNTADEKPFLLIGNAQKNQANDPSWAAFWSELTGAKLQLRIDATEHGSSTDYPTLANAIGVNPASDPKIAGLIGSINPVRMSEILEQYIGAFVDLSRGGKPSPLLERLSTVFPEVSFSNTSGVEH